MTFLRNAVRQDEVGQILFRDRSLITGMGGGGYKMGN